MIKGLNKTNLIGRIFYGEVVDNNDPDKEGRCRVKVYGIFDDLDNESIPWASSGSSKTFGGGDNGGFGDLSIPKMKAIVRVSFFEGDIYSPEWVSLPFINTAAQKDIADTYLNSHLVLYDEDEELKVYYTPGNGMEIYLKKSHVTINPDASITIEHADSTSIIELVGSDCNITTQANINVTAQTKIEETAQTCIINGTQKTQLGPTGNFSAVGAEPLWAFLKSLSAAVDAKWPASPGVNSAAAASAETASTSKIVKVTVP